MLSCVERKRSTRIRQIITNQKQITKEQPSSSSWHQRKHNDGYTHTRSLRLRYVYFAGCINLSIGRALTEHSDWKKVFWNLVSNTHNTWTVAIVPRRRAPSQVQLSSILRLTVLVIVVAANVVEVTDYPAVAGSNHVMIIGSV